MKKRTRANRIATWVLTFSMLFSLLPVVAMAADTEFSDMPNDYSTAALESAVERGLLQGNDGLIMPDKTLTRAEMAAILVRALDGETQADMSGYTDMDASAWYYEEMAIAVNLGLFADAGDALYPTSSVTGQEALAKLTAAYGLDADFEALLTAYGVDLQANIARKDFIVALEYVLQEATRGEVVVAIHTLAGLPADDYAGSQFSEDLGNYQAAADWAAAVGIAEPKADGTFGATDALTKAEAAIYLAGFLTWRDYNIDADNSGIESVADYADIPADALDAMTLCYAAGVFTVDAEGKLNPDAPFTQIQLADFPTACGQLIIYDYNPETPYDGVKSGLINNIPISVGDDAARVTYYLPEDLQPWTPAIIILTPDNTTAEEFANSETGLAWRAVADDNLIGLAFMAPAEGGSWNLTMDEAGRDDGAVLNQLYFTMRSKALTNIAPYTMDKAHTTVIGYEEGGAAALLFGARYATDFSGLAAVDATEIPAESLAMIADELVIPFPADSATNGIVEMDIQAKEVDMSVWFINSAEDNDAAVTYFIASNDASEADANEYADTVYQAADSIARIWISDEEPDESTIYDAFLGTTKRIMGMEEAGRIVYAMDFTTAEGFTVTEMEVNGLTRRWITYVPSTYTGDEEVPLVFGMHGYTASMQALAEESRWFDVAEENGFIVIFPQAVVVDTSATNIPASSWQTGNVAEITDATDVDLEFFLSLIEMMNEDYAIDNTRIYATGHSNGGNMSWGLGVRLAEVFAAIAPIGAMTAPATEISDVLLPTWALGGEYDSGLSDLIDGMKSVTTLTAWTEHNGVDETTVYTTGEYDGQWVTLNFTNEDGVPLVKFTEILRTPHTMIQEESYSIWNDFFSKYSRGEDGTLYYEGVAVEKYDYVADDGWYAPAE